MTLEATAFCTSLSLVCVKATWPLSAHYSRSKIALYIIRYLWIFKIFFNTLLHPQTSGPGCCRIFDRTVKLWDCVNKVNWEQGAEPVSSWQELAIEHLEDLGRWIETHTGSRVDLEIRGSSCFWMVWKEVILLSLRPNRKFSCLLLWSGRFSPQYLTPRSLLTQ